ncbi:uncharacterized protein LOC134676432 [Cydia fagiglandana]|uniref:uncharacterized protein LOC134676432 n=1 Tax=Cydia fagiglandana TaxID=1458189 RepID=UPI002FEE4A11
MASVRYMLVAVLLVTVLVYCSAKDQLVKKLKEHVDSCKNETPKCMHKCIFKKMGIINKAGQYVDKKAVEWMKIATNGGILTQPQAIKIAKICNRGNVTSNSNGCHLAEQVSLCINKEMEKMGVHKKDTPHGRDIILKKKIKSH